MKMENTVLFSIFYCHWRNKKYKTTAAPKQQRVERQKPL